MDAAPLDIHFIGHATVLLESPRGRILTDPFLRDRLGPLSRHGPLPDPAALEQLDVVLISHAHQDHFDPASLGAIPGRPAVVVPRGLGPATRRAVRGEVIEVEIDDVIDIGRVSVTAVNARHWQTPGAPRAQPLGYRVNMGASVYFAGDTGRCPEMAGLAGAVDVAMLPVWTWGPHLGPGHLGPRSAAEALHDIRPAVAIPIHWGTLYPNQLHRVWRGPLHEPGDRFAEHARRVAPQVDVRVLRPGARTTIDRRRT